MFQKKGITIFLAVAIALALTPFVSTAQAPQGQPPAGGQRPARGEGRGEGQPARGDAAGRGAQAPPAQAIKQVKPGVYMVINGGGNSTVRVTDQGVLLVDTKNLGEQFYNDLLAQIKTVTPQPVKYAFVT